MRTLLVLVGISVVTIVYSVAVMLHMVLFRDRQVFYRYARSWSRVLLRLAGVHVRVILKTHASTPAAQPSPGFVQATPVTRYVYASNHASLFDIPVLLASLPDNVRIMYKRELERIPIFGWGLRLSPFIAVDRSKAREANQAIEATAASIKGGESVLVFPEGTRSSDGTLGHFKRGVVSLAVKAHITIRPVVLVGTHHILPAGSARIRSGNIQLILLDPISVHGIQSREEEREMAEHLRTVIQEQLTSRYDD